MDAVHINHCAHLEKKGVKYDFCMNAAMAGSMRADCSVPEGLGRRHFSGVLECLGRATGAVRCPPEKLVAERLRDSQAHGVVFVTPERDDAAERAVRAARRRCRFHHRGKGIHVMLSAVTLKIVSDLGFYLTFAGFFAGLYGARPEALFGGWAVLTAAFAVSWLLRERGWPRFLPLAFAAAAFVLLPFRAAESAVLLPGAAYAVYLAAAQRWEPEQSRAQTLFSWFWKLLPLIALTGLLAGKGELITSVSLPVGFVTLLGQVLLTRALRHSPEVRSSVRYQLTELGAVLAAGGGAFLLSSRTALRLLGTGARAVYDRVIGPVLYLLLQAIVSVIGGIVWLVSLLQIRLSGEEREPLELDIPDMKEMFDAEAAEAGTSPMAARVFTALGILLAAALLFLFFRWLAKRGRAERTGETGFADTRGYAAPEAVREGGSPGGVRAAYRKFLRLCAARGVPRERSDTSLEIQNNCGETFPPADTAALRALYLRARYGGGSGKTDAARARELLARLKRQ